MKFNKSWIVAATLMSLALLTSFSCAAREEQKRAAPEAPDPAFDPLMSTLEEMTTAPIMLPARLPPELKNVVIASDVRQDNNPYNDSFTQTTHGDKYTILFLAEEAYPEPNTDQIVQDYAHYKVPGTLMAEPANVPMPDLSTGGAEVTDLGNVALPNSTVADLKRVEPPEGTNAVPFTYGTFEEGGHRYTLRLEIDSPTGRLARQTLSTMVHA